MRHPYALPRQLEAQSHNPSPWSILACADECPGAGRYLVQKSDAEPVTVQVYSDDRDVPAYVRNAVERQHNADMLAITWGNRIYPRAIISRDSMNIRMFIVTASGLSNVTWFLAQAYGYRLRERSGERRWISMEGGGYSPDDAAAEREDLEAHRFKVAAARRKSRWRVVTWSAPLPSAKALR